MVVYVEYTDEEGKFREKALDRVDFDRTTLRGYENGRMVFTKDVHKVGSIEGPRDGGGGASFF